MTGKNGKWPSAVPKAKPNPWCKLQAMLLGDPMYMQLSDPAARKYHDICMLKTHGTLDKLIHNDRLNDVIGMALWMTPEQTQAVYEELLDAELIDAFWQPLRWRDGRYSVGPSPSTNSKDRVAKWREENKAMAAELERLNGGEGAPTRVPKGGH